jgi:tRNA-binding EMAP/Myf-like protein
MDYNNQVFGMCCCASENAKLKTKKVDVLKTKDNSKKLYTTKENFVEKPAVDI